MEAVRTWLISLICISMFLAVAQTLTPEGSLRKIGAFTGGLLLIVALMRPVLGADLKRLTPSLEEWTSELQRRQEELEADQNGTLESIIARRTEAYILDKAEALGLSVSVRVSVETGADGIPVPVGTQSQDSGSPELVRCIEEELGIPAERQVWNGQEQDG